MTFEKPISNTKTILWPGERIMDSLNWLICPNNPPDTTVATILTETDTGTPKELVGESNEFDAPHRQSNFEGDTLVVSPFRIPKVSPFYIA